MDDATPDRELLSAWAGGDADAGDLLVQRHFSAVFRFLRNKVGRDVDDLVQGTFTACLAAADRFRAETSMRGFLLAIARKQLLHHLRKAYRRDKVFDPATISLAEVGVANVLSPSAALVAEESERLLLIALERLPLDFQITIELYYWEELPIAEIAGVLEVAEGTVKSRLGRARALLREHIERLATTPTLARATADDLERWARSVRDKLG